VRIAYLINQYPAISHSFIRREILALEQLGFEIVRIALRGWDRELADDGDRLERERTRYVLNVRASTLLFAAFRMLLERPIRLMQALGMVWHTSRISERPLHVHLGYLVEACRIVPWLREEDVKHVHAHFGTNSAEVAMLVHLLGGPRWSFTAHGIETFDNPRLVGLSDKVMHSAFVVAVSSYGRAQIYRSVQPEYWHKVHLVHCGLDPIFFAVPKGVGALPRRIVCVGRLSPEKGHVILLEAAQRLAAEGMDFKLILAGDGELRGEIESKIEQYKLTGKVQITGWINGEQVREEILSAQALVLPSLAEGLPVVIMEAMALQRPVIATFIAGVPELVRSGENGWLVPAGDVSALVDAIRTCLETPIETLTRMGDAGRVRVLEQHDINKEAVKLQKLFQSHVGTGLS
jgi:glycosyltransferase involved in cell wall biosynthesis